jgi:hypothetical protein
MSRVGKAVHGALCVLRVAPDLTVGIDMGGLSHIMRERGEVINGGHDRTVSPVPCVSGHEAVANITVTIGRRFELRGSCCSEPISGDDMRAPPGLATGLATRCPPPAVSGLGPAR